MTANIVEINSIQGCVREMYKAQLFLSESRLQNTALTPDKNAGPYLSTAFPVNIKYFNDVELDSIHRTRVHILCTNNHMTQRGASNLRNQFYKDLPLTIHRGK